MPPNPTPSKGTGNIVDPNADVAQSKVFLDLCLGGLLGERKIDPDIFQGDSKMSFWGPFFRALLAMLYE
jgi:hypothetical protein